MNKILPLMFFAFLVIWSLPACSSSAQAADDSPLALPAALDASEVIAEGRLEPIRFADLSPNISGLVAEVLVAEGDQVAAGQVIARVENPQAKSLDNARTDALQELTSAYAAERDAQYQLDNYDVPADFSGMAPIQAVEYTLDKLNTARDNFEPYEDLSDKRLAYDKNRVIDTGIYRDLAKRYKKELDDAWADYRQAIYWLGLETNLESAQTRLEQAQKDYNNLQDAAFSEDTAGTRAALATAELRASFAGTMTRLDMKAGEFAISGQPIVTLADLSSWVVTTTDLTEIDVVNVYEGQPAEITLDAMPAITLNGTVLSIGQSYTENQGDIVYEVAILLTDKDPAMRWGMTAEVRFLNSEGS